MDYGISKLHQLLEFFPISSRAEFFWIVLKKKMSKFEVIIESIGIRKIQYVTTMFRFEWESFESH